MKQYYTLLDKLISCGESKNIMIKYQTNLTKLNNGKHNFLNYIPHFKEVTVVVSIDGIGIYNDYIRRRSKFSEIETNIEKVLQFDNVCVDINGTLSVPGVLRYHEVLEYFEKHPKLNSINWWMIKDPKQLRINNLPWPLKQKIIPYYEKYPAAIDIVNALKLPPENDANFNEVCNYLLLTDESYRGTKWEMHLFDVFPELEEFYERDTK